MELSIRYKVLLGFALILALSYTLYPLGFKIIERYIRSQTNAFQLESAERAAGHIRSFIATVELDHLGIVRAFRKDAGPEYPHVTDVINYTLEQNRFFKKLTVLTPTGREVIKIDRFRETPPEDLSFEIPTAPFDAAVSGRIGVSKVYFSELESAPQIDIFSPIVSEEGLVLGVIKGQLQLGRLWDLLAQVKLGESGFAYLVDEEGRLIAHPNTELLLESPNLSSRPIVAATLADTLEQLEPEGYTYINEEGLEVTARSSKISRVGWIAVVEQPVEEAFSQLLVLRTLLYTTIIGSFLLSLFVSLLISESFTRPIRTLQQATELLRQGQFGAWAEIRGGDELGDLADSFNSMANQIKRRDLDLRAVNKELEHEKEVIVAERNKLTIIISGISDAVIAVDLQRKIIIFNKAAEDMTGFKSEVVLGKSIEEVITVFEREAEIPSPEYCPIRTSGFEGVVRSKEDLKVVGANKKETQVNLIAGQIQEGEQVNLGCILTLHDITREKELEEMKLDFVSMAAHELRTPLTAIRGYLSVFMDEHLQALDKEQQVFLTRIEIAAQQLTALIENLLSVSRIERSTLTLHLEPTDWVPIVKEAVGGFKGQAADKELELSFTEPARPIPKIKVDRLRIVEVLSNLLSNAINYTQPGGKIRIWVESKGAEVVTHVEDTGIGISKEDLPQLFTKFFRVSGELAEGSKGTGLGLFISKSIIEMHAGKIWVKSELGKGSTFSFSLQADV